MIVWWVGISTRAFLIGGIRSDVLRVVSDTNSLLVLETKLRHGSKLFLDIFTLCLF